MNDRIVISVSSVLRDLDDGLSRTEIKKKYNLTGSQLKQVFQHTKLKHKKAKKPNVLIEIVDDTEEEILEKTPEQKATEKEFILEENKEAEDVFDDENNLFTNN